MKISNATINILKNFASINQSIVFDPGKKISTIAVNGTIMGQAEVEDDFPQEFAIYDLGRFLNVLSLFENPTLEFGENYVDVVCNGQSARYPMGEADTIESPPDEDVSITDPSLEFDLKSEDLKRILKAASIYGNTPHIAIIGDGEKITLCAMNASNSTEDAFSVDIGETDEEFRHIFDIDNLKILVRDYTVKIKEEGEECYSEFSSGNLKYFIALEDQDEI